MGGIGRKRTKRGWKGNGCEGKEGKEGREKGTGRECGEG